MGMSTERYRGLLAALLPPGIALNVDDQESELNQALLYMASWLKQADDRAQIIRKESDPRAPVMLLPEWEYSLGLPDECTVLSPTIAERQRTVYAKFSDIGGARIPRYLEMARALGYENATITRFKVHTCEMDCEQPINDDPWRFAWQLNLPKNIKITEATCQSSVEEPLRTWGETTIECIINREAQGIGLAIFAYNQE